MFWFKSHLNVLYVNLSPKGMRSTFFC